MLLLLNCPAFAQKNYYLGAYQCTEIDKNTSGYLYLCIDSFKAVLIDYTPTNKDVGIKIITGTWEVLGSVAEFRYNGKVEKSEFLRPISSSGDMPLEMRFYNHYYINLFNGSFNSFIIVNPDLINK